VLEGHTCAGGRLEEQVLSCPRLTEATPLCVLSSLCCLAQILMGFKLISSE
jgi:hypothetical protein